MILASTILDKSARTLRQLKALVLSKMPPPFLHPFNVEY